MEAVLIVLVVQLAGGVVNRGVLAPGVGLRLEGEPLDVLLGGVVKHRINVIVVGIKRSQPHEMTIIRCTCSLSIVVDILLRFLHSFEVYIQSSLRSGDGGSRSDTYSGVLDNASFCGRAYAYSC